MKLNNSSGKFAPCPEYDGPAVCVDVTPLKKVVTQFGEKEKFRFVFETGLKNERGEPWCVWSAGFTPSFHPKAALRPFLRNWLGRDMTEAEAKEFDTESMLGQPANLSVVHTEDNGTTYANIGLIRPDKAGVNLKPSGKFVRAKDRPPRDGDGAGGGEASGAGWRRAAQPVATAESAADLGATKVHVGKCKGIEVRDLAPEQVLLLVEKWLPDAKANPKPTADDKRLIAALEWWSAAQPDNQDDVPY